MSNRAKQEALQKLLDMLDHGQSEDLKGMKLKPLGGMEVKSVKVLPKGELPEGDPLEEAAESPDEEAAEPEEEPSDEEKAQIEALYHKYCMPKMADGGRLGDGSRFASLQNSVEKEGYSPEASAAIAAHAGREKYGDKKMNQMAQRGKKGW